MPAPQQYTLIELRTEERLQLAAEILEADHYELASWFAAIAARLGRGLSADIALELTASREIARRNALLREAARCIDPDDSLGRWDLAGRLSDAIHSYERLAAQRERVLRYRGSVLELKPLHRVLQAAFACRVRMLRSQRNIYEDCLRN
jgi:hypothetical protein